MKFQVIIASKNNPAGLIAVTQNLQQLQSGLHDVGYTWIVDREDHTFRLAEKFANRLNVAVDLQSGDNNLYGRVNAIARKEDADITALMCDDVFPLVQGWDQAASLVNCSLFAWNELANPGQLTYPFINRKWREACGYCLPEMFPFWFADSWIAEVFLMSTCCVVPVLDFLPLGGKRGKTRGLRDCPFWFDYWFMTRKLRIAEAERISGGMVNATLLPLCEQVDEFHRDRLYEYEKNQADSSGPPSVRYLKAKRNAEIWLEQNP